MAMFVFPGQGSQAPGMGQYLYDNFASVPKLFEEASDAISIDIKKLCFASSEAELTLTENTQPALLVCSFATAHVLQEYFGIKPTAGAGHSIGEYAALVTAGVMPFASAVKAVRRRGQAMQAAVPAGQGAMAAVMGLEPQQVQDLCAYVQKNAGALGPLSPANFNAPGQIVISGSAKAMDWLKENAAAAGFTEKIWGAGESTPKKMRLIPLQVSAPFHCALMKPAEEIMRDVLGGIAFTEARFPILQNFTAKVVQDAATLKENLIRQVSGSVLWMQSMQFAAQMNWTNVIECGHGKVLSGLLKKIDANFVVQTTNSLDELKAIEAAAKVKKD